jgi:tRNA modification GTPase
VLEGGADVIAAIATATGEGGIGVIRVSGAGAHGVVARVWAGRFPQPGEFRVGAVVDADGSVIDEALLLAFQAPHSYTGEDVAELQCHGGSVSLGRCLGAVLAAGARPARAGEFTERAFLNGRLDLTQAEAVIDLIRARTDSAARQAVRQLVGEFGAATALLRERVLSEVARLEACLDYPDEVEEPGREELSDNLAGLATKASKLAGTYRRGRLVREGLSVAIVGRPNVGKSSLLNALAGAERAIVTSIPGTTRDAVRDWIEIDGLAVEVVDTAGLRESGDEVEQLGMERSRRWMEQADLVLVVLDGSEPLSDEDRAVLAGAPAERTIVVLNKSDRGLSPAAESGARESAYAHAVVAASALSAEGVAPLREAIRGVAAADTASEGGAVATRERHWRALTEAAAALDDAAGMSVAGVPLDLLTVDLRRALLALGEITGETVSEYVVERIFAEFCVGK